MFASPTLFGPDVCSTEGLGASGLAVPCHKLSPACAAIVVSDPRSFNACVECYLTHALDCMVATTYAISGPEAMGCFVP